MAVASPQMLIADLRRWLGRMDSHGRASAALLPFGLAEVDGLFPNYEAAMRRPGRSLELSEELDCARIVPAGERLYSAGGIDRNGL